MGVPVVGALAAAAAGFFVPYGQAAHLAGSYTVGEEAPSYAYRAPFVVADQLANRDLDNVIGDRVGVHAVQTPEQPNQYTSLVIRRGWFQGYEAVQVIRPPLVGAHANTSTACRFAPEHGLRLGGGTPGNNLDRAISLARPFSLWHDNDAYGYCDGEDPVVVVPLKTVAGFWPVVTERPDGVALYRGGELTIHAADAVPADVQGPTYPRSIAEQQRASSLATGTFSDWLFKRAGYDTAGRRRRPTMRMTATRTSPTGAMRSTSP